MLNIFGKRDNLCRKDLFLSRPKKSLSIDDKELINQTYSEYKFGACYLESIIESKYNRKISHNRIHTYLLSMNLARQESKRNAVGNGADMSVNITCLQAILTGMKTPILGLQVCAVLDDSSRKIIAGENSFVAIHKTRLK